MAEDYGVTLKITADTSALDQIPQKVEATRKEIEKPVEQPVVEKHVVEDGGRERPAPAERTETVKVDPPKPVVVPVKQDPDPLKIAVEPPKPVVVPVKQDHDPLKPKVDQPEVKTVKVPVEKPEAVKIEAKAEKVRVEVEDAEAKKRIEALTKDEGVKRIRVVTEGGELATRQGGKEIFELEVDAEKAKKTIADLKADARLKVTADTSQAIESFNALRAMTAALHGNIAGLGIEIAKIGNGFGLMKSIGVGGFSAIAVAIMVVVSLASALRDLFATMFNVGTVGRDISSLGSRLGDIRNEAENFASAMDDARKAADLVNQSLEKEISALGRVAKAQNEINRQRELAAASSDDERANINSRYNRRAIDIGANTAQQSEDAKRKAITDEINRLEMELDQAASSRDAYLATAKSARGRANFYLGPNAGTVSRAMADGADNIVSGITGMKTDLEKAKAASAVATDAQNAADDEIERIAALEEELENKRHELKMADLDAEARKAEQKAEDEKNAAEKAVRENQKAERQQEEQDKFDRERGKTAEDAAFEDRMRAARRRATAPGATETDRNAAENEQIELLRVREDEAKQRLEAAQKQLADELKKPATERDETALSRAREDIREADSTALSSRRQREDIEQTVTDRRATVEQDYFGRLARQIEASRPKDRLTAMGLGSGVEVNREQREMANNVRDVVSICRELLAATKDNKPVKSYAKYAP